MENVEVKDLFYKNRFPTDGRKILSIILYAPFGLLLAFLRFSILVQAYLLSSFFPESVIKRLFLRAICTVLGIIVREENKSELDKAVKVFMSNHITYYDHIPLYLITGSIGLSSAKVSAPLNWGLKDLKIKPGTESAKAKIQNFRGEIESPILIYPEEETTSGSVGLLKFSPWYAFVSSTVQPVCLKLWRPPFIDIAPNTIESSPLSDLLWFLFSPLNVFTIKYSPVITKTSGETNESFMGRIEDVVANGLNIKKTAYTASDKVSVFAQIIIYTLVNMQ
uniref:Phospholipid/glycerol acyltransferase domain-containing protein n=1 Tax=Clastoptera arizonana TaxID=38151 RepID=A0A1B6DJN3_9HEMI